VSRLGDRRAERLDYRRCRPQLCRERVLVTGGGVHQYVAGLAQPLDERLAAHDGGATRHGVSGGNGKLRHGVQYGAPARGHERAEGGRQRLGAQLALGKRTRLFQCVCRLQQVFAVRHELDVAEDAASAGDGAPADHVRAAVVVVQRLDRDESALEELAQQ